MDANALVGSTLGTYTLQQLIGQGSMAAVYLAQQSYPHRQVAVKVLLPEGPLTPDQLNAFLTCFRQEINAAALLEHPNIVPVYEYGDVAGLAYLVMPYMCDGTLHDLLKRDGAMALSGVADYLDHLATTLDFVHKRGIIHRNIKPANIMLAPEGRLQFTDLGLGKVLFEKQKGYSHLTLEYVAPEQILGEEVDERADLYSLAVILYQMVTGKTPFQAATSMRTAVQQIRTPPPSPRTLRPDLPVAAEQVMLQALAKRPADRYASGQNLATAFRVALTAPDIEIDAPTTTTSPMVGTMSTRLFSPRGLFDPIWQTGVKPSISAEYPVTPLPGPVTTGHLIIPGHGQDAKRTIRLTGPVKVVRIPIAGQSGQYVTGLLPALPEETSQEKKSLAAAAGFLKKRMQVVGLILAVVIILLGTSTFWFVRSHSSQNVKTRAIVATPNVQDLATAQAVATADANVILSDPLSQNIHNWVVSTQGSKTYVFENGAYHITNNDSKQVAPAILQNELLDPPFVYSLTMQEIKGDDTSVNNSFGMIISFNQQTSKGKTITTFYSFEVVNTKSGEYQFWKYDDSKGGSASPWQKIWHHTFGREFQQGHRANIFQVVVNGTKITFRVNGKVVGTVTERSISSGDIGMLVNLKGTEVAFSDLKLTHN
jgi:serine/threonine protein kinase